MRSDEYEARIRAAWSFNSAASNLNAAGVVSLVLSLLIVVVNDMRGSALSWGLFGLTGAFYFLAQLCLERARKEAA